MRSSHTDGSGSQGSRSLRSALIKGNVTAVALLLVILGVVCRFVTLSFMMRAIDQELERGVSMVTRPRPPHPPGEDNRIPPPPDVPDAPPPRQNQDRPGRQPPPRPPEGLNPYRPLTFTAAGVPEHPQDTRAPWDAAALRLALRGQRSWNTRTVDGEQLRIFSAPAYNWDGQRGAVQIAYPLKDLYTAIAGVDTALLLLILPGLAGAWWLGAALTARVLRPVQQMTIAAGQIGASGLAERLPVAGSDEFSELARTFNGLLARLEMAFVRQAELLRLQQRFTADASHELKTPLTVIKGRAGVALARQTTDEKSRQAFLEIDRSADTMARLVQDLLLLARSDEGRLGENRVEMLAAEVIARAQSEVAQEGAAPIRVTVSPPDLALCANEAESVRLLRNLLENALRFTPPDGEVRISACRPGEQVVLKVEDNGSGVAPEHLAHLGERFYRVEAGRERPSGGSGLGLSICRGIAEAHGGTLTVASEPGQGTTVTVLLPLAAAGS